MPPLIWGGMALAGVLGAGWGAGKASDAFENASTLTKWVVIGGGIYVSYRALQSGGVLR